MAETTFLPISVFFLRYNPEEMKGRHGNHTVLSGA